MQLKDVVRSRFVRAAVAVVGLGAGALGATVVVGGQADAVGGTNLLANPGFEGAGAGDLTGWTAAKSTAVTLTSPGATGSYAANVAYSGTTTGAFYVYATTKPVKAVPAGEVFVADVKVRVAKVVKKPVCLQLLEQSATATVQTVSKCVTPADTAWHAVGPTTITMQGAGNSVKLQVRQASGAVGYAFQVDDLTFVDPDTVAPSVPTGVTATVNSATSVTVKWKASTDTLGGVVGYKIYRNNRTSVLATVVGATSYTDKTAVEGNTYSYKVVAYDVAGNTSALSAFASAATPWVSAPVAQSVWHMADAPGSTTMADSTGTNPGTLVGTVTATGSLFQFVAPTLASGGHVLVPTSATLDPLANRLQFSVQVNTGTLPAVPDYDLFRKGTVSGQEYKMEIQPNGQATCSFTGDAGHATVQNGPALGDGAWHTITCSKDATTVTLTIDGQSWTKTVTIGSIASTKDLVIGAYPLADYFNGQAREAALRIG